MTAAGRALGRRGEEAAAAWYEAEGWEVLARNWRCPSGELDLVCGRDGMVAVCEVKARAGARFGGPLEAVTPAKQARVRRLAAAWLAETGGGWRRVRFDVVGVSPAGVDVVEEAF